MSQLTKHVPVEQRFWLCTYKTADCWFWVGSTTRTGYGLLTVNGVDTYAHRFSYALHFGGAPEEVCHTCDIPNCVNPTHLVGANKFWNMKDRVLKGRLHTKRHWEKWLNLWTA